MSEKQDFNKGASLRQIAEKRRERWLSRKILSEIIDAVRKQRDDANWVIYQVLKKEFENLNYKSKIKMFNWLANSGYDVENLRPEKTTITLKMDAKIVPNFDQDFKLLNELYTHLTTKALRTAWETKKDCKKFGEILDKIEKRISDEKNKNMAI